MGLFSFLKKDKKDDSTAYAAILGMVLLEDPNSLNLSGVAEELKNKWKLKITEQDANESTAVLVIEDYHVAISVLPVAIPGEEIEKTVAFNYFWENGEKETDKHKGHVILSITNAGKNPVRENLLYCKLATAVMNNSKSIGIYIGGRSLVLKKDFYLSNVEMMTEENFPLYNWIYFGLRKENEKQSIYTYGLADFGKLEMEIVDSDNSLEELNDMMYNLVHYVLAYDVILNDGETIGISAEQKLRITKSSGRFLEGTTLKIEY